MHSVRAISGVVLAVVACSSNPVPAKWTLWYVPNEPKVAVPLSKECRTFVFASVPDAKTFRVVIVKHVTGAPEDRAFFRSSDDFSGPMELGTFTIHDDSTGYDVNVDSVYRVNAYVAAKARADSDCPPAKPVPQRPPLPRPSVVPTPSSR